MDSSRGWAEKTAIPEEQYTWLESDLARAAGKRIFVFTHVPPTDPRDSIEKNTYPNEPGTREQGKLQQMMNDYNASKSKDHGFPDPAEAARFEGLMTKYHVDTVFASHIHSYFSFVKGDVRYIISGGSGAELLTTDSYYHYLRIKASDQKRYIEMIELPSPANTLQDRYGAAIVLFARSMLKEYTPQIAAVSVLILLPVFWMIIASRRAIWRCAVFLAELIRDVAIFAARRYREMKGRKQQ